MTKVAKKKTYPGGEHINPRRKISAPPEQWKRWDAAASAAGRSWAEWARKALDYITENPVPKERKQKQ